jgi:hypothetical protein
MANSGGGGGAGGGPNGAGAGGGSGGSGIVVISYQYFPSLCGTSITANNNVWFYNSARSRWMSVTNSIQEVTSLSRFIQDTVTTNTSYFSFPAGTSAQRPIVPSLGFTRFNTTLGYLEYYDSNGIWQQIDIQST